MLAVALSLFGEGFNGPDESRTTQINWIDEWEKHISCGGMGQIRAAIHSELLIRSRSALLPFSLTAPTEGKSGSTVSPSMPVGFNQRSVFDVVTYTVEDTTDTCR